MPLARRHAFFASALLLAVGCGGGGGGDGYYTPPPATGGGGGSVYGPGKINIAWTIAGQPASDATCSGIDHLELSLDYGDGAVTIEPIPCAAGRMRYDNLPAGDAAFTLDGLDASGCGALHASALATIGDTVPDPPAPLLDLTARRCR